MPNGPARITSHPFCGNTPVSAGRDGLHHDVATIQSSGYYFPLSDAGADSPRGIMEMLKSILEWMKTSTYEVLALLLPGAALIKLIATGKSAMALFTDGDASAPANIVAYVAASYVT